MPVPSTFSIVGRDPDANELGVAVQSKFLSVGSAVPWVEGGVGAIATQAWANTNYGPRGLEMLRLGKAPEEVIRDLVGDDEHADERQVGIVDAHGRSATYTGSKCMDWAGGRHGVNYAAQGNILAAAAVVDSMVETFTTSRGHLADRLVAALARRPSGRRRPARQTERGALHRQAGRRLWRLQRPLRRSPR